MNWILLFATLFFTSFNKSPLSGAWKHSSGEETTIVLIEDGYLTSTTFTSDMFLFTFGGKIDAKDNKIALKEEFNTSRKKLENQSMTYRVSGNQLTLAGRKYARIDNGDAPLAGVWKITGRQEDGKLNQIHQRGTRKTLKMLTGKRFQWFAIDPDGNQFFGTGGGTYTFENGKYTENIDFFSRDNSRVGASLSFDGKLEEGKWHHSGLSSRGDRIYEIWEKALD